MPEVWSAPVQHRECGQGGEVFQWVYLLYCDEASLAWCASRGTPYIHLAERGLDMQVVASTLEWSSAVRLGEVCSIDVMCDRVGRSSFVLRLLVRVGDRLCCTVTVTNVLIGEDGKPTRVPEDLKDAWLEG